MKISSATRRNFIEVAGGAGLAFFGFCRLGTADESVRGVDGPDRAQKILRVGMARPMRHIYPVSQFDQAGLVLSQHLGEHLCAADSIQLRPVLATRWWSSEDDTLWTFEIRPDVVFHDGETLTAGDVAASITRQNDDVAAKIVDPLTVAFRLPAPDPHFPWSVSSLNHASIIVPAEMEDPPVGTGPFRLHDFSASQGTVFLPHEGYWNRDALPPAARAIARLEFVYYADAAEAYEAALRGDVDRFLLPPV